MPYLQSAIISVCFYFFTDHIFGYSTCTSKLQVFFNRLLVWLICQCMVTQTPISRGTDFPRSRNRGRKRGKAYLKRNSRFSPKTLLVTFKKHTLLSKQTFQRHFENRNSRYLTTLIFVSVMPN